MKKIVNILSALLFVLLIFTAVSGYADTLVIGGNDQPYTITYAPSGFNNTNVGAGSFTPSNLDGQALNFLYCVDLTHYITIPGTYNTTVVTNNGVVHGTAVTNAIDIAWLLHTDGQAANSSATLQQALQIAIWKEEYGTDFSYNNNGNTTLTNDVNSDLNALALAGTLVAGSSNDYTADFAWLSPASTTESGPLQGLVGQVVPEPGTIMLLGVGVFVLALFGKRRMSNKV